MVGTAIYRHGEHLTPAPSEEEGMRPAGRGPIAPDERAGWIRLCQQSLQDRRGQFTAADEVKPHPASVQAEESEDELARPE